MNDEAVTQFLARINEARALLDELNEAVNDYFGADPDAVNWTHVGTAGHLVEMLREAHGQVSLRSHTAEVCSTGSPPHRSPMTNPNVAAPLTRRALERHADAIDQMETSGSPALADLLRTLLDEVQYLRAKAEEADALSLQLTELGSLLANRDNDNDALRGELARLRLAVTSLEMDSSRNYDELTERLDALAPREVTL